MDLRDPGSTWVAYEPIDEWINGMGVVLHEPA
jgi:hypothetical protein